MSLLMALLIALPGTQVPAVARGESAPAESAQHWAMLVDQRRYAESWNQAGALLKSHIAQAGWVDALDPVRKPLGALASRKLKSETPTRSLPGVPDGDYDVLVFDTDFAGNHSATETIVLARESSGWKVDGYFIK